MDKITHKVTIESRNSLELNGVTDMGTYNDEEVEIDTVDGFMIISGTDLNVVKLDVETGICALTGKIDSVSYIDKNDNGAKSLFRRIFK